MSHSDLDGGEALLQACRDLGADCIFSSAGSEWAPVWEALARRDETGGDGPRYLDLTHETLAVAMATGYATVTGRGQVVLLHAGAGLLQGANAIHGALLTGVPMVVCSGESTGYGDAAGPDPGSQWYRNLSVVGGPQAIAAPFTKWACAAADVAVLYGMVKRAGELAAQPPAGPVYVNTPVEVLLARWQPAATGPRARASGAVAVAPDIEVAVRLLRSARRPVLAVESAGRDPVAADGGPGRAVLAGQSIGAAAALRAALDRPDRASGVILAHSLGGLGDAELAALVKADRAAAERLPVLDRLLTPAFRAERPDMAFLFRQMGTFNTAKMAGLRNLNSDGPTVNELAAAPFPVLLLAGERDNVLSPATVRRAGELLPNARVEIVPAAPHSMYWETPALFNDAVRRFLKEVAAA